MKLETILWKQKTPKENKMSGQRAVGSISSKAMNVLLAPGIPRRHKTLLHWAEALSEVFEENLKVFFFLLLTRFHTCSCLLYI